MNGQYDGYTLHEHLTGQVPRITPESLAELRAERDAALERIKELELYASDTDFDRNDMTRQLNAALEQVELLLRGTIQYVELLRQ